jgi:hypothetical protein
MKKERINRLWKDIFDNMENKKRQVTYIAPLQPFILAAFLPWGGSTGAGRIRLAGAKVSHSIQITNKRATFLLRDSATYA